MKYTRALCILFLLIFLFAMGCAGSARSLTESGTVTLNDAVATVTERLVFGSITEQLQWLETNAVSNTQYRLEISDHQIIEAQTISFSDRSNITVRLYSSNDKVERFISLTGKGSLFTIGSGVTMILDSNITLEGNRENNTSLVTIMEGGNLIIKTGAKIINNSYIDDRIFVRGGAGVYVRFGGTLTMVGGIISGNIATRSWGSGGVHVQGTFTMSGGEISNNTAGYHLGGGVTVGASGTFTMSGGKITRNIDYGNVGGGGVAVLGGMFTMSGGEISNNRSMAYSGGVTVIVGGTFIMSGGIISKNEARMGRSVGGVSVETDSNFMLLDGEISGNSGFFGGGVIVKENGNFTMSGGEISSNKHGGVRVYENGTFTMAGGIIKSNTSSRNGGGVFVSVSGTFIKNGGIIYGYTENDENSNEEIGGWRHDEENTGHAVYVDSSPVKRRETTAGPRVIMDSRIPGSSGGWEN